MAVARKPAVRKAAAKPRARALSARPDPRNLRLAGVSNEAVQRATGKNWEAWLKLLDHAGAKRMAHKEIALLLSRKCGVPDWWSQMVTVGYEQARGLRDVYQHADGYAANASRTIDVGLDRLFEAWTDPKARSRWLPKAPLEVRRRVTGKTMRMAWMSGASRVEVNFQSKGAGRSSVHIEHGKLPNSASVTRQKAYWSAALARLKALLEDEG